MQPFPRLESYFERQKMKCTVAHFWLLVTSILAQKQIILTNIHTYTHE